MMVWPSAGPLVWSGGMTLYVSTAVAGDVAHSLGTAHYSYHFAAQAFVRMLTARGVSPHRLAMPEYYADAAALPAQDAGVPIHLMFRSTEQMRLLKPGVNIGCFAWEFPVLRTHTLAGDHPFANQYGMLALCDEIWTPSRFAAEVLRAHGLNRALRIPAPVDPPAGGRVTGVRARAALADIPATTLDINRYWPALHAVSVAERNATTLGAWLQAGGGRRAMVFLAVLNPEDFRKNLDALLRGFVHFRRQQPRARLLVKLLTASGRYTLAEAAGQLVRVKLAEGSVLRDPGIAFISAYLSDAQMTALYSLADCYVCTSLAEGQNLPLLEAMAHGTLAVTTRNTAMEDYITDDNAFVIDSRMVGNTCEDIAGTHARVPFDVAACTARDVYRTLCAVAASAAARRASRARAGTAAVHDQFGTDAVWALVRARLDHYQAGAR